MRELEEETGYFAKKMTPLISVYWTSGRGPQKFHFFYTDKVEKRKKTDFEEKLEAVLMDEKGLSDKISRHKIVDSATIFAFLFYKTHFKPRRT